MRTLLVCWGMIISAVVGAQVRTGIQLLPNELSMFSNGQGGEYKSGVKVVTVAGQPFEKVYQFSTLQKEVGDTYTFNYPVRESVQAGDILWLTFYTRSVSSKKETGEAFAEISLDRMIGGKYDWPPVFERGISFGKAWTLHQIPFIAARNVQRGDLSFVIKCGRFPQVFEIGAISLVNYRQTTKFADLAHTTVHYEGDAADAPWRTAAIARIEKIRKGNLAVQVVDNEGNRLPDVQVTVQLKRSSFAWGTATNSRLIRDSIEQSSRTYRDTLLTYFNKVVFENEVKSKNWSRSDHKQTIIALDWLHDHDIPVRGHVMVWPSWQNSPHLLNLKNDTSALRAAILNDIDKETSVLKNQFAEWDVVNEPFAHDVFLQLLGRDAMVDWFRAARVKAPGVKLFLNDYTMFHGSGEGSPSEKFFDNIRFLQNKGAPIDAIGEQGHIGGTPPGMEYILERLDHFATFGLPIQISEFDITSDDEEFKARYMGDFMTAIFSHASTIGLVQWGFWAGSHWIPAAALWDKEWKIRPAGTVFTTLVNKTWNTHATGVTDRNGVFDIKGFTGEYEISATYQGKTIVSHYLLDNKGGTILIKLK